MRGNTLLNIRRMVKGECGYNLQAGVALAQDSELNSDIELMQQWLWTQHQWPFLYTHEDLPIVAGQRYYNLPKIVSLDYPTEVEAYWANLWYPVYYGIKGPEYDVINPDMGETDAPIQKWQNAIQIVAPSTSLGSAIEVWPMPSDTQVLRYWGTSTLPPLKADTDVALIDDLLIALFVAADKLGRSKQADASAKLTRANTLFNKLKAANRPDMIFALGGTEPTPRQKQRIISVVGNPNH